VTPGLQVLASRHPLARPRRVTDPRRGFAQSAKPIRSSRSANAKISDRFRSSPDIIAQLLAYRRSGASAPRKLMMLCGSDDPCKTQRAKNRYQLHHWARHRHVPVCDGGRALHCGPRVGQKCCRMMHASVRRSALRESHSRFRGLVRDDRWRARSVVRDGARGRVEVERRSI
jgi:hypothetical protein